MYHQSYAAAISISFIMPWGEPSWEGCKRPAPYQQKEKQCPTCKDAPKTAAKSDKHTGWKNLTLRDWVVVFEFVDQHPNMSQRAAVEIFEPSRMSPFPSHRKHSVKN
jgi:hypothetical protein